VVRLLWGAYAVGKKRTVVSQEPESIQARDALVDKFVEKGHGYRHLKPAPDIDASSDGHAVTQDLFSPEASAQLNELKALAERYFKFKIEFFKFTRRSDRTLRDLLRRPFTHSDLQEEDIEEKFPEDRKARALIKALYLVIEHNQWVHIRHKREWQALFSAITLALAWGWLFVGYRYSLLAAHALGIGNGWGLTSVAWIIWLVALALGAALFVMLTFWLFELAIDNTTSHFKEANRTSCAVLISGMTSFNANVSTRFTNLLSVIKSSEDNSELVQQKSWPDRAKELFKIAMWEGKRIESMEGFWQLQFERLRLLELLTDIAGNLTSVGLALLAILISGIALLVYQGIFGEAYSILRALIMLGICAGVIWRLGSISRRAESSFGMNDIISQGFGNRWAAFGTLGYYEKIAQEFENGMGAKRLEKIKDINLH